MTQLTPELKERFETELAKTFDFGDAMTIADSQMIRYVNQAMPNILQAIENMGIINSGSRLDEAVKILELFLDYENENMTPDGQWSENNKIRGYCKSQFAGAIRKINQLIPPTL